MTERYLSIVDVHVILRREGTILLLRRAGNVYATGMLCPAATSKMAKAS
jgi:hypothetical protein